MKDFRLINFLLLILMINPSCKGQEKPISPKEEIKEKSIDNESKKDFDPYFLETQTSTKTFGPIGITRNILQDKNGNYWLAAWEGIMKYDGKTFTNFTNKDSLRRYHVFSVLEDRKGNIWFGTIGAGVYFYDGKTFTNYATEHGLAYDRTGCIYEDKKGDIWIGTERGISLYQGKSFQNFIIEGDKNNSDVNSIIEDEKGNYWIGTRGKAFTFDGKNFTKITKNDGTPFVNVRSIIKDRKGNIWLGGNDGLWRYDGSTFTRYTQEFVGYIYEDSKGNIWTSATLFGNMQDWALYCYDENSLADENANPKIIEPNIGMIFGIMEDSNGYIWFGSLRGIGRYNGMFFEYFKEK